MKKAAIIVFLILLVDQVSKIWIKTNMALGDNFRITDWAIIHFIENPGMAFGMELGGDYGKLILTLFRIVVVGGIIYWLRSLIKEKAPNIAIVSVSLILAGAIGNIIDSIFYGVLFGSSYGQVASFLPAEGGYAGWFHGQVVDMLYFPLFKGYLPEWLPIWGGDYFIFFRPIFNVADTSISVGVLLLLIFQKTIFKK